jgi:putative transposase
MSAHQAVFPIATMARVLGVSKAGYYAWRRRSPSAHAVADRVLMKRIRTIHVTSHETYASPVYMPSCGQQGRSMDASALPG